MVGREAGAEAPPAAGATVSFCAAGCAQPAARSKIAKIEKANWGIRERIISPRPSTGLAGFGPTSAVSARLFPDIRVAYPPYRIRFDSEQSIARRRPLQVVRNPEVYLNVQREVFRLPTLAPARRGIGTGRGEESSWHRRRDSVS